MDIVALVDGPDHVCCRYRVEAFRPRLESAGHRLRLETLPRSWWSRWSLFRRLRGANVILQRRLLPYWQLLILRNSARRLLFDFDDSIFLRDSYSPRGQNHPRRWQRFCSLVRRCDAVIAGNSWLAAKTTEAGATGPVVVVPTCVEPADYTPTATPDTDAVHLVWIGSSSTLQGLERVRPLLTQIAREVPRVKLKLICDRAIDFAPLPTISVPWRADTEARELAASHVGISWVPDDDWSRGKCGLKILQYMASGLPVVANPVGVHPEMVVNARTGYLPASDVEWAVALRTLADDADLRRRMGHAGRQHCEAHYGVAQGASRWLELLERLERPQRLTA